MGCTMSAWYCSKIRSVPNLILLRSLLFAHRAPAESDLAARCAYGAHPAARDLFRRLGLRVAPAREAARRPECTLAAAELLLLAQSISATPRTRRSRWRGTDTRQHTGIEVVGPRAIVRRRHLDLGAGLHLGERLHVAKRPRPDVARAREPGLIALRDRRAAETNGDGVAIRPVGDLAGLDHRARIASRGRPHRNVEIDLLAPGQRRAGEAAAPRRWPLPSAYRASRHRA